MRLQRATLLISSVSILSALNVFSAPVHIVVVDKIGPNDADGFLRSVRIGLAGAKVNLDEAASAGMLDPDFRPIRIISPNQESTSDSDSEPKPKFDDYPEVLASDSDSNSNPATHGLEFPELPSFIEAAMDEARNAAIHAAEREHDRIVELENELENNQNDEAAKKTFREVKVVSCSNEKSWRAKMTNVKNWFRKLVGLSIIQRSQCSEQVIIESYQAVTDSNSVPAHNPVAKFAEPIASIPTPCHKPGVTANIVNLSPPVPRPPRSRHGRVSSWRRPQTFWGRLQKALYSLSPWEGRALAFVLGCGIGVLLRMVYVFIVLGVRLVKCKRAQAIQLAEQDARVTIFDVNEFDEEELPPPMYNEDEDEKRSMD